MTRSRLQAMIILSLVVGLQGCSGDDANQEVQQWMNDIKRETKVSIPKLSEPKKFIPFIYGAQGVVDPYNPNKLTIALAKAQANSNSGFKPDLERRREPLESYPLDTLIMVGTLQKASLSYAILKSDKTIFQAKVGNYVGQNLGMITKITETEVDIKEIVQDAAGDWVERKAKLELQETKK
ncbi:MAG: pilus assembly protein PilP [Burkholderiales bacterium RIFCSPLOWO2_02_FULL_57_36]|nr:MAG: pilus assembly protein PilP [Burkholderiales bacterium RIFCSPLOWO2_02_FULL_57_36]